jgi:hypothetical protein
MLVQAQDVNGELRVYYTNQALGPAKIKSTLEPLACPSAPSTTPHQTSFSCPFGFGKVRELKGAQFPVHFSRCVLLVEDGVITPASLKWPG